MQTQSGFGPAARSAPGVSVVNRILDRQSLRPPTRAVMPRRKEPPLAADAPFRCLPIVHMDSGSLWGFDVQTDHSPAEFERALHAASSIRAAVRPTPIVSVTVCPEWFERPDAVRELDRLLSSARLDPSALMLAMSERTAANLTAAAETMRELLEMGVRTALSNLGEGFASLGHVRALPLEFVKVPPSFIEGAGENGEAEALLSATLRLLSILELEAIATGVTTQGQADALLAMRCHLGQGPGLPGATIDAPGSPPASPTTPPASPEVLPAPDPPVAIEPIVGWRARHLVDDDGEPRLASVTRPNMWPPGDPLRESCGRTGEHRYGPAEGCTCGQPPS
jgi:EAL domain-containing protein (putative c-di-GMP-specific phosphodiesterase class I)